MISRGKGILLFFLEALTLLWVGARALACSCKWASVTLPHPRPLRAQALWWFQTTTLDLTRTPDQLPTETSLERTSTPANDHVTLQPPRSIPSRFVDGSREPVSAEVLIDPDAPWLIRKPVAG